MPSLLPAFCALVLIVAPPCRGAELKPADVSNQKGDGPDGKGNTADDTWQFWFELAHQRGQFQPLDTFSTSVPRAGVPRKVTGPIAGFLPSPEQTQGWIFHRDWDGRFEGVWADSKNNQIIAYPYCEKNAHMAVAITYRVPGSGVYDIRGGLTDLQVQPQIRQHDGIEWIIEIVASGKTLRKLGTGEPIGDGNGRPDSGKFEFRKVALEKGQLVRLVIHPRKWWGSDMTRIDSFQIDPVKAEAPQAQAAALLAPVLALTQKAPDVAELEKQRCPKPTEFISVFSNGYAGDSMPKEPERFEELLKKLKEGGFNVIHCTYSDQRLELCKKHGIMMMIDLLAEEHHVYKSPEKAKVVCEKLRGNPTVWGYNIWNDSFRKTGEGRRRDINSVRTWDPTHPAFSGTYRVDGIRHLVNADAIGYYDYHWKREPHHHFPHLLAFHGMAKGHDAFFYRWLEVDAGQPGKGNAARCTYSVNTSIACGLKGALWFLGTSMMNSKTLEWTTIGQDICKVNAEVMPLRKELTRLGNPLHIYSTLTTKSLKNDPLEKAALPPGLANNAFPADFWLRPLGGEFVLGAFKDRDGKEAIFVANHNAYEPQEVKLKLGRKVKVELFDRKSGKWQEATVKDDVLTFPLTAAGGELLRFTN